jgi:ADP-ribose pyrophosphatase YjhB (NUDIX family)
VTADIEFGSGWLSADDLEQARERLPIVYVEVVPVRLDSRGSVTAVGLLLRAMPDGSISRALVSGRVHYGELIRDALIRHIEKDLGPMALPRMPASPAPTTVAEYFPDPGVTGFHDPRQHSVSLVYVIPMDGDCVPSQNTLDLAWVSPDEAQRESIALEMTGGQHRLIRITLAYLGSAE